jgi:uncharacterized protein YbjT (DUF2867 family)
MNAQETVTMNTALVLGDTGKTGRRVAKRLTARGVPVRIGSRTGEPPFDWEDRATWAAALRNVSSVTKALGARGHADALYFSDPDNHNIEIRMEGTP